MKKQKNATRIIAIVLVLLMALALIPFAASAATPDEGSPYYIMFDGNGATTGSTETVMIQKDAFTPLTENGYEKPHFYFLGWSTSADGEVAFADKAPVRVSSFPADGWLVYPGENVFILYAQWGDRISVHFEAGDHGTGSMASVEDQVPGSTYTVPDTWSGGSDTGWEFAGWKQGSEPVDATIELPDTDVTLTAQWKMEDPVTYTFNGNHATEGNPPDDITRPLALLPAQAPGAGTLKRTGYTFVGWTETADGTPVYEEGDDLPELTASGTKTMYAKWEKDEVTIKFLAGDTAATGTMSDVKKLRGTDYYLPTKSACSYKVAGKDFYAWQVENGSVQEPGSKLIWPAGEYTTLNVTALWKPVYTVTCYHNDGSGDADEISVVEGESVEELDPLPNTTIGGKAMKFIGWYASPSADPETDAPYPVPFTPDQDVDLYAGWLSATIPVKFDKNGGTTEMADGKAPRGGKYTLPDCEINPPKAKTFKQWLIGETAYNPGDEIDVPLTGVEEINVKAMWQDDVMQGTVTVTAAEGTVVGKSISATANITNPVPAGTVRYQWARSDDGESGWEEIGQPGTSNKYTIQASDLGKYLRCTVTCSNKTGSSLLSDAVGPVTGDTVTLTVTQSPSPGTVTFTYSDGTEIGSVITVSGTVSFLRNATVTMTVTPPGGMAVETVDGQPPQASYPYTLSANASTEIVYKVSTHSVVTQYPSAEPTTESTDPTSLAGKATAIQTIPASDRARVQATVYDLIVCYDNNPSDRVTDADELRKQIFTLRFPDSVSRGNYGAGTFDEAWTYKVYHYDGASLTEVTGVSYDKDGSVLKAIIKGQTNYSPFIPVAAPKDLTGKVILTVNGQKLEENDEVSPGQTLHFSEVTGTNAVDTSFHYGWYYSTGVKIDNAADDTDYVVKNSDIGKKIVCRVTHDVQTGYINSSPHEVAGIPNPTVKQHIINDGSVQKGMIGDVTSDMQYYRSTTKPGTTGWTDITGSTLSNLVTSGRYWIRFGNDSNSSHWVYRDIYDYYTVTCRPDSVSGNRLAIWVSNTIVTADVDGEDVEHYYGNIWLVRRGKSITAYAQTKNENYYKVVKMWTDPEAASWIGKQNYHSLTIPATKTYQPYIVWASAGVYGSKTGDTSHLELWVELAALSLMGLGAALVIGRKKLKAQK